MTYRTLLSVFFVCACRVTPSDGKGEMLPASSIDTDPPDSSVTADPMCESTPAGPLLVHVDGEVVWWMSQHGEVQEAPRFSPPPGLSFFSVRSFRAGSAYALVGSGYRFHEGEASHPYAELVVFDATGKPISSAKNVVGWTHSAWLATDGTLAYAPGPQAFDATNPELPGVILRPNGAVEEMDGWAPMGTPISGEVPACAINDPTWCGWYVDGEVADVFEVSHPVKQDQQTLSWIQDGRWFRRTQEESTSSSYALPPADEHRVSHARQGWTLISGRTGDQWRPVARFSAQPPQWEVLAFAPPEGTVAQDFSYCNAPLGQLADDGALLMPFRDDTVGLWRSDDAVHWQPVGESYGGAVGLSSAALGATVLIHPWDMVDTYCVVQGLPEEGLLDPNTSQVVRDGRILKVSSVISVPGGWPATGRTTSLSPDGACVLVDGVVHDLITDRAWPLDEAEWAFIP